MTTNDEQYVPDAEDVRSDYAIGGAIDTIGDIDYSAIPELKAEFDRFIAKVKRDAAREALDGLADQFNNWAEVDAEESARTYRDTRYPTETED